MNIKKIVIQLIEAGKPSFPTQKGIWPLLGYVLRLGGFALLYGCSLLYGTLGRIRLRLYQKGICTRYTLPCPVISIGNITTGGTGKTPMVILIARMLRQHGKRVAILSRGYRRTANIPLVVRPQTETCAVQHVGDEPLLIAQTFQRDHNQRGHREHKQRGRSPALPDISVVVGKRRYLAGKLAIEKFQPDVIVLDDGFQHLQLARTCDLVLIDATNPFGGGHVLPAGFLREPVEHLARADAFVITRSNEVADVASIGQRLRQINPSTPIFMGRHVYEGIRKAGTEELIDLETLKNQRLLSVSGLGNPASFHRLLTEIGLTTTNHLDFPDHHWYTTEDGAHINQHLMTYGLDGIITTEKDEAKLAHYAAGFQSPLYVLVMTISVQPAEAFEEFILSMVRPNISRFIS